MCNDATRITGVTFQGHGGFAIGSGHAGHAQGAAWDDGGGGIGVAAHVDGHVGRLRGVLHGIGLGRLRFEEFRMLDLVVLGLQQGGEFVAALGQGSTPRVKNQPTKTCSPLPR